MRRLPRRLRSVHARLEKKNSGCATLAEAEQEECTEVADDAVGDARVPSP